MSFVLGLAELNGQRQTDKCVVISILFYKIILFLKCIRIEYYPIKLKKKMF